MKIFFFGTLFVSILIWQGYRYWPVTIHIERSNSQNGFSIQMPLKDKRRLDFFFREACFLNVWSYTLLGSKPMSIDQYTKPLCAFKEFVKDPEFKEFLIDSFCPPNFKKISTLFFLREFRMKLGWEALNKYLPYFSDSRFFLYEKSREGEEIVDLILIDKIKLIKVVKENIEDFDEVLKGMSINLDDLLNHETLHIFLRELKNDRLFGILLGFGRNNARLFNQCLGENFSIRPMISAWPEEEMVNLEQLNQKTQVCQPWDASDIFYPRFACDPESDETKKLKQNYRAEREVIIQYFEKKDIVEAVLNIFNQAIY